MTMLLKRRHVDTVGELRRAGLGAKEAALLKRRNIKALRKEAHNLIGEQLEDGPRMPAIVEHDILPAIDDAELWLWKDRPIINKLPIPAGRGPLFHFVQRVAV